MEDFAHAGGFARADADPRKLTSSPALLPLNFQDALRQPIIVEHRPGATAPSARTA